MKFGLFALHFALCGLAQGRLGKDAVDSETELNHLVERQQAGPEEHNKNFEELLDPDDLEKIVTDDDFSEETTEQRELSMVAYGELSCNANANIGSQACLDTALEFSALVDAAVGDEAIVVPCGACYTVDYVDGSTIDLPGGLDILGRLHFPTTANVTLNTTSVIVQGLLDIPQPLDTGTQVKISLYGTNEVYYYPHDNCPSNKDETCAERKPVGKKSIAIVGGQVNIQAIDLACPSWSKIKSVSDDVLGTTFQVEDPAFASCLSEGDEVVIASDTHKSDDYDMAFVASVDASGITMTSTVSSTDGFATTDGLSGEEKMLAVEIASLSRQVIFEGQSDIPDPTKPEIVHGGHLIVFHTPNVVQTISGVKFDNFGQDGNLGRYPVHFHMCGNTASTVSKNVVVNSNQRCYVIHDTNDVTVSDNVAFNNKGHCFITETGYEERNVFAGNLGVYNKKRYGNIGQSDDPGHSGLHQASTFWIRNMKNDITNNIAAGSPSIGFWIEMKSLNSDQGAHVFKDNVAHSHFQGFNFYKKGWKPTNGGLIEGMVTFRNEEGLKMHITGNVVFKNSWIAENVVGIRYGVWNSGVTLLDSTIMGRTDDSVTRRGLTTCARGNGVRPSWNNKLDSSEDAMTFTNVTFSKFNCGKRTVLPYHDGRTNQADMGQPIQATQITYDRCDSNVMPFLSSTMPKRWFLEDGDGTLSGPDGYGAGFVVRDVESMKAFAPAGSCAKFPASSTSTQSAFCEGVCLRQVKFSFTDPAIAKLELTNAGGTSYTFTAPESFKFYVVLPGGTRYTGHFLDASGQEVIDYPAVTLYKAPLCGSYVKENDFVFISMAPTVSPTMSPSVSSPPSVEILHVPVGSHKKCPMDGTRLFKDEGPMTLEACRQLCYDFSGCHYFSYGADPVSAIHEGNCMGCTSNAALEGMTGFETYEMVVKQDFGYDFVSDDKKCPFGQRVFKTSGGLSLTECANTCETTAGCERFTWGTPDVTDSAWEGMCMGCATSAGLSSHTGFMAFEISAP